MAGILFSVSSDKRIQCRVAGMYQLREEDWRELLLFWNINQRLCFKIGQWHIQLQGSKSTRAANPRLVDADVEACIENNRRSCFDGILQVGVFWIWHIYLKPPVLQVLCMTWAYVTLTPLAWSQCLIVLLVCLSWQKIHPVFPNVHFQIYSNV